RPASILAFLKLLSDYKTVCDIMHIDGLIVGLAMQLLNHDFRNANMLAGRNRYDILCGVSIKPIMSQSCYYKGDYVG
ncbi:MAG: hypothetical protein AAFO08_05665, partial [Pseudomonadota bacterium]